MFVITPSDHTDVNVQLDLLLNAAHRTYSLRFVLVRIKETVLRKCLNRRLKSPKN